MASRKKSSSKKRKTGGPYIACAVFCDSVVKGEDGALTAVRMIDRVTITIPPDAPADVPSADKQVLTNIAGIVGFKSGDSPGKHEIKLSMNSPSGEYKSVMTQSADFRDEPHGGYNLRMNVAIAVQESGLHWMDVFLDDRLMTRMPLLISVNRAEASKRETKPAKTQPESKARTKRK